jgi:hypothetical protein
MNSFYRIKDRAAIQRDSGEKVNNFGSDSLGCGKGKKNIWTCV